MPIQHPLLAAIGGLWSMLIGLGFLILAHEEFTPVKSLACIGTFPPDSEITLSASQSTLIVFVHPLCPCTRATFHELEQLLADTENKVSVFVVFTIPNGLPPDWKKGDLWRSAVQFDKTHVLEDPGGAESRRFSVEGSGHCLLYSPAGHLLFSGGITASRGHDGENPGRMALVELINTGHAAIDRTPVFGCSLL